MAAVGALRAAPETFGVRTFQWHSDFIDTYGGVLEQKLSSLRAGPLVAPFVKRTTASLWTIVRAIARRCDATLVASAYQARKLTAHRVPNVVHRPFGIERDVFRPDARSFEARRDLLALAGRDARSDDVAVIVGVGRFAIEKRWELVIEAFLRLRARGRDAILVLFGDGPERDRMREQARSGEGGRFARDVVFPGFSKDRQGLAASLAIADMLLHGCPFETFGLSIAEAMACGLPCVVPNDGGAAEMHDPESGETYVANDVTALTAAAERLLDRIAEDPDRLRAAAVRKAQGLPTVHQQFEHQLSLYTELIARRRRP